MKPENLSKYSTGFSGQVSLLSVLRAEWKWWIPGAIFVFFLASILLSGWPSGLLPNVSFPYLYEGDFQFHSWMSKRVIEGWLFENARSGYPFGSNFLDYPGSDSGSHLIHKIIGLMSGSYVTALNLYFLLGFVANFIASFAVLRALGLSLALAISGAIVFDFIPFHFLRLGHLFYTWYFVVPLFFYAGFRIFYGSANANGISRKRTVLNFALLSLAFIALASFGVYYALFGVIVLATSGLAGFFRNKGTLSLRWALISILMVVAGVLINTAPNIVYTKLAGKNPEVAQRSAIEAELYGLKLVQLALPRPGHRINSFARVTQKYSQSFPLVNENSFASLGLIGAAGGAILCLIALCQLAGRHVDIRLAFLAIIVIALFMSGTIGGFGTIFAITISPAIRGWNRISIFIGFGTIAAFFLAFQIGVNRYFTSQKTRGIFIVASVLLAAFALFDQTTSPCQQCISQTKHAYQLDRDFISSIERTVPQGTAIYQLPYIAFPEVPSLNRLTPYDLGLGFIHSTTLRWSFGGMKGREGDLFYRALGQQPMERQLDVIRRLGFGGIYIDRRGYEDNGNAIVEELSSLLHKPPTLQRADGEIVFFRLDHKADVRLDGLSNRQIMEKANFIVDKLGPRYKASLSEGIDFRREGWPEFLQNVTGLSQAEAWGRWSDAEISPRVRFDFVEALPNKFTLILEGQGYGPNINRDLAVALGGKEYAVKIPPGVFELRIPIDTNSHKTDYIEFRPPRPTSPLELGASTDSRKLGIGFIRLRIE